MSAPPDLMFWLIYSPFCCSSRSWTNLRTLPAWPQPPDAPWRLATASASHRFATSSRDSAAHYRLFAPITIAAPTPSPRAAKKTSLPNDVPTILTPMGARRDPYAVKNEVKKIGVQHLAQH